MGNGTISDCRFRVSRFFYLSACIDIDGNSLEHDYYAPKIIVSRLETLTNLKLIRISVYFTGQVRLCEYRVVSLHENSSRSLNYHLSRGEDVSIYAAVFLLLNRAYTRQIIIFRRPFIRGSGIAISSSDIFFPDILPKC